MGTQNRPLENYEDMDKETAKTLLITMAIEAKTRGTVSINLSTEFLEALCKLSGVWREYKRLVKTPYVVKNP